MRRKDRCSQVKKIACFTPLPCPPPIFVNITLVLFCYLEWRFSTACQNHLGNYLKSMCTRPCIRR